MGEMISSFDGTKLYFNREMPEPVSYTHLGVCLTIREMVLWSA